MAYLDFQGTPDKKVVRGGRDEFEPQAAQFTTRFEQLLIQSKVPTEICSDCFKNSFMISNISK